MKRVFYLDRSLKLRQDASDQFFNGWEVEQGYAYILTHPGVPTVNWKHYFDWGSELQDRIRSLINARKVAGVGFGYPILSWPPGRYRAGASSPPLLRRGYWARLSR